VTTGPASAMRGRDVPGRGGPDYGRATSTVEGAPSTMNHRAQSLFVWGGVVSIALFAIGWCGLMQFLPPLAPSKSATEVAAIFDERRTGIRFGAIFMIVGTMLWVPWAAVVAVQTRRSERDLPLLGWTQIGAAATSTAVIIVGQICWVVAAFRPTRDPELTQLLVDLGFVMEIMPFAMFVVWNVALALAIFGDRRATPAYPRWAGYMCLWTAFLYLPGGCLAFFQTGPFAWNGALAFFLPAAAFFAWIVIMTVLAMKAIARERTRATAPVAAAPGRPTAVPA
jgi:hypothetical protein